MQLDVVTTLREAGRRLMEHKGVRDRDAFLGQLVVSATELISGADGGGLSRTAERDIRSSHATTQAIYDLDQLQDRLGEGPCISAATDPPPDGLLIAHDLDGVDAARWPRFAPHAVDRGFRSVLSLSLVSDGHGRYRSALNLYSATPSAFDEDAVVTAALFANQLGGLLHGADTAANLTAALESRDVIGRAKGILMERFTCTDAEAFEMLVGSSQDTNIKLVGVATWLVQESETKATTKS